jgi:hypothetical protein
MKRVVREKIQEEESIYQATQKMPCPFEKLKFDFSKRKLKPNHDLLPLYVGSLLKKSYKNETTVDESRNFEFIFEIFLETFNPRFKEAYEFVISMAEPKSRQEFIQCFQVNSASLYASVTLGYTADQLCTKLESFNKIESLNKTIINFIHQTTSSYGKCRLVLQENSYFLESEDVRVLEYYQKIQVLNDCWIGQIYKFNIKNKEVKNFSETGPTGIFSQEPKESALANNPEVMMQIEEIAKDIEKELEIDLDVYRLKIKNDKIDKVRIERDGNSRYQFMLSQEYEYTSIDESQQLKINLKSTAKYYN